MTFHSKNMMPQIKIMKNSPLELSSPRASLLAPALLLVCLIASGVMASGAMADDSISPTLQPILDEAVALEREGKLEEAVSKLKAGQDLVQTSGDRIRLTSFVCRLYAILNELDQARKIMKRMAEQVGETKAYVEASKFYLDYSPEDPANAVIMLKAALEKLPDDLEILLELARARVDSGNFVSAVALYNEIIKRDAGVFRAYYGLADAFMAQDRFEQAVDTMNKAIEAGPDVPENFYRMGRVHERNTAAVGYRQKAIWWYHKAVDQSPDDRFVGALAFARIMISDITGATALVERYAKSDPDHSLLRWIRGLWLEQKLQMPQALQYYREAVSFDHLNIYAHLALAYMYLGVGNRGYAFFRSGGFETFRYMPFIDTDQAANEVAIIRSIDPHFPGLVGAEAFLSSAFGSGPATPNELQVKQLKKLSTYYKKLNTYR